MNRSAATLCREVLKWIPDPKRDRWLDPSEVAYLQDLAREATRKSSRRPAKVVSAGRMHPSREEYRTELQRIRGELCDLTKGWCERCGLRVDPGCGHVHHTISGSGKRRQQQSVETCAFLCPSCHHALHREPQLAREFRERLKIIRQIRETDR